MKNNDIDYTQRPVSNLPDEFLNECLEILDNIDNRKADCVNWEERSQMDEATMRSGNMLFDEKSNSDTFKILNNNIDIGNKKDKPEIKEAKPKDEKEAALMAGLADIMEQVEKLDEAKLKKSNKEGKKDGEY